MNQAPARLIAIVSLSIVAGLAHSLHAAVLTVGPGGTFSTIQSAMNAALSTPEADEIRVATGTFAENLRAEMGGQRLSISGGWRPGFQRFDAARRTVVHGSYLAPVLDAGILDGSLTLDRLELAGGMGTVGGGLAVAVQSGRLELANSVLRDNVAQATSAYAAGGGAYVELGRRATFVLRRCTVLRNIAKGYPARGGGVMVADAEDGSGNEVSITSSLFVENATTSDFADSSGAGLQLDLQSTRAQVLDVIFRSNRRFGVEGQTWGTAMWLAVQRDGFAEVRRIRAVDQQAFEPERASQVFIGAVDRASVIFSDSEVGRSAMTGIKGGVAGLGSQRLINLTVVDNQGTGIDLFDETSPGGEPPLSVANSILFGNRRALLLDGDVTTVRNLVDRDPGFIHRAAADYRLRARSLARNAGANDPPGGLGPFDVTRRPRLRGGAVDQGANEIQ